MITHLMIEQFKSIVKQKIELGRINLFIGANGSGKSNILEALGVLGAAAFGRVEDETLLRRGVRPGVPKLYKTGFKLPQSQSMAHIHFSAHMARNTSFDVTLWNPIQNPTPAWRFKTEKLISNGNTVVTRTTTSAGKHNQEQGMSALKVVDLSIDDPALKIMDILRNYSIYCPNTPSLRGLAQDMQTREPIGLAGGRLPEAVDELINMAQKDQRLDKQMKEVMNLVDWAKSFSTMPSTDVPLSSSAARTRYVIQFIDKYMKKGSNKLTGYDASEGALYILFCAVLALHTKSPKCIAIDNVDQALNPILAKKLVSHLCRWTQQSRIQRQFLFTAHNPAILDGLILTDNDVALFAVQRNNLGHTVIDKINLSKALSLRPDEDWTLSRMWTSGLLGGIPNV